MESVAIRFDDAAFDRVVHNSLALREGGDVCFVVKDHATTGGKPAVVITFSVALPNGEIATAQAVITGELLIVAGRAMEGRFAYLGIPR